jgi:hypothetical protein
MFLADRLELGQPRRTKEGYLAVRAKAARAGVYDYRGREIDPEGQHFAADQVVKVYRPEDEVFDTESVRSFLLKPITNDHPAQPVTADNWKTVAKGVNAGAMRDGEYLAFDLVLMDAGTIDAVESGKKQLSNGYQCELEVGDGTAPDGTAYQATQRRIRGNHVAIVDKARAGAECRIGDAECVSADAVDLLAKLLTDQRTYQPENNSGNNPPDARRETSNPSGEVHLSQDGGLKMPHTLIIDGLQVPNVSDEAKAAIEKLQGQLNDERTGRAADKTALETQVATLTTDKATLEAKVTTLEKQVEDSKITPTMLRDAAKAFAITAGKAKALGVDVTDDMDEPAIMKAVVTAKLGDAAKDWTDIQIAASFATLAKDARPAEANDPLRQALADGTRSNTADAQIKDAYEDMVKDMTTSWEPKKAA